MAVSYSSEELEFVRLINDYRASYDLEPLMVSDLCSDAAEKHSSDMGKYGFFSHTTRASDFFKAGSDAGDRLVMCGYHFDSWGECIAAGHSTAAGVLKAWQRIDFGSQRDDAPRVASGDRHRTGVRGGSLPTTTTGPPTSAALWT